MSLIFSHLVSKLENYRVVEVHSISVRLQVVPCRFYVFITYQGA